MMLSHHSKVFLISWYFHMFENSYNVSAEVTEAEAAEEDVQAVEV